MSRLSERFRLLKERGEKALVLFVMAGDPSLDSLPSILGALAEGGADIIEVGIPFSDPIADGPTIQAGGQRALEAGVTPPAVLDALSKVSVHVPVVLMGYYNPILRWGLDRFALAASGAGASGTIVTDLTPEEAGDWVNASHAHKLDTVFLAAPTSTDARLDKVCALSSGFVYAVSRTGVTGANESVSDEVGGLVGRLKARTDLPVCVGFGISTPDHVRRICEVADGAVIGSWLVHRLHRTWDGGKGREELVDALREFKEATQRF